MSLRELSVLSLEAQRFAPLENKRIEKKQTNKYYFKRMENKNDFLFFSS